jgi:fatty-acyl-CoA synthase
MAEKGIVIDLSIQRGTSPGIPRPFVPVRSVQRRPMKFDPRSSFTLWNVLHKNRIAQPTRADGVALIFENRKFTYPELEERALRLASALHAVGFRHGDRVAMISFNRPEWFDLFFALAKLGGVLVPINYYLKPVEIRDIIRDAGASWVVCQDELWEITRKIRGEIDAGTRYVVIGAARGDAAYTFDGLQEQGSAQGIEVQADLHDLFLLQYTSGTTGLPKGVMHTQETILWNVLTQIADFRVTRDDVYLNVPALCWAAGFHDFTLETLWVGGTVVLSASRGFDGESFCRLVAEHGATRVLLVPSALRVVLGSDAIERYDMSSLRYVLCGAEPVPVTLIEQAKERLPNCKVQQGYGLSEFPAIMLFLDEADAFEKKGSTGRATLTAEVRVVDLNGRDCAPGENGEIVCRSPQTMLGYYNKPDATAETIRNGWLYTGDQAYVDADGYVYISGRKKDMIITGGLNVYPAEIERVLEKHPAVKEVAVIGVPDEKYGEVGRAVIVLHEGRSVTDDEFTRLLREQLAHYKVPRQFAYQREPLPRTTSGKVQKFLIRQQQGVPR